MEAISEVDWTSSLTGMYQNTEEEFMAQLLHNIDIGSGSGSGSEDSAGSGYDHTSFYALNTLHQNVTLQHFHHPYLNRVTPNNPTLYDGGCRPETEEETIGNCSSPDTINGRKRLRIVENVQEVVSEPVQVKKNKSSLDSDESPAKPPPLVNLSGKARVPRGSATDPQSVYARKRRERINERLKTLQTLIPNGTKVDLSTMLEDAVEYVKFLQHQIKLLSSDEEWMYAPIAYNVM